MYNSVSWSYLADGYILGVNHKVAAAEIIICDLTQWMGK